jgi:DNA-binding transcriptional LysR family regulator
MDVRQLEALVAVAEHRTFSAAARALHTVQSNISTHVARLEKELGVLLVDRAVGKLTPEGEVVVARARRVAAELEALSADVASLTSEVSGRVRVGTIGTTGRWVAPHLLDQLAQQHPGVELILVEGTTSGLLPLLLTAQIDLAVVNMPLDDPDVSVTPLFDEDLILIAPLDHELASGSDAVTFEELSSHRLLLGPKGSVLRHDIDVAASEAGVRLKAKAQLDGVRLTATLAFQGYGAAIVPSTAMPTWAVPSTFVRRDISKSPRRSVGLAMRRRGMLSTPATAVRDLLESIVEQELASQQGLHPPVA